MAKKVLFLVAAEGFQPLEYGEPKQRLEQAGITVITGSDGHTQAIAKDGSRVSVDITLADVQTNEYDGVFLIGGPGALDHLDTQETHRIINEAMLLQIPYGAICIASRILAKAHVLTGKRATGWNGDGALATIFEQHNVQYVQLPVVVDGTIITAVGPEAASAFGDAIIALVGV